MPWTYTVYMSKKRDSATMDVYIHSHQSFFFVLSGRLRVFTVVAEVSNKSIFPFFTVRPHVNDRVK